MGGKGNFFLVKGGWCWFKIVARMPFFCENFFQKFTIQVAIVNKIFYIVGFQCEKKLREDLTKVETACIFASRKREWGRYPKTVKMEKIMKEDFLHYVWQNRHYDFLNLKTTDGRGVKVVFPGYHNHDAGPDFLQAVVELDGMRWVGSVEIHCRSSDWLRHNHQYDDKYRSVILHVVYEYDMEIKITDSETVPTLELKGLIPKELYDRYASLVASPDKLLCRWCLPDLDSLVIQNQLSKVLVERMTGRQDRYYSMLEACNKDWRELVYRMFAIGFGCKKNATAFELLAQSLPYRILKTHHSSKLQIYALLFGQSGMLDGVEGDEYTDRLRYEYDYLRYKYQLTPIGVHHWNWLRLRPQNFPSLRLAQFAQLLYETGDLLSDRVLHSPYTQLLQWLTVAPDAYWERHYQLGKPSGKHASGLGRATADLLVINTVVPLRFCYARFFGDGDMQEDALALLERVRYENNKATRVFTDSAFPCNSAYDSQAQMELMEHYCERKRCLSCSIGEKIVRGMGVPH